VKSIVRLLGIGLINLGLATIVRAQTTTASPAGGSPVVGATNNARTDVYLVHFTHAALAKAADLGESLKMPGPNAPQTGHMVIFRHQYGDSWDYVAISHFGTKLTVEAAREQVADAKRDLSDWHNDTIVNGPSWAEFSRALGLGDDSKKTSNAVYVVSYYRVAPGHRAAAEKNLSEPANPAVDKAAGTVLMQHLEGSPWQYLGIVRYNSWQDLATSEANSVPETSKKGSPWSQLREHIVNHTDTLCDRILP
jgi:hypothetical protein